jgi:hypothetical protein
MATESDFAHYMRTVGPIFRPLVEAACVRVTAADPSESYFRQHGTASLFSIADMHFLVTAAHLFDEGEDLFVENNLSKPQRTRFRPLGEGPLALPIHDVAIVRLRAEVVAAFSGMRFLTMQDVALGPATDESFLLCGYPQELNADRRVAGAMLYFTRRYAGSSAGINYNPKTELLFEYDLSFSSGEDGTPAGMPDKLHGMSGSAIWRVDLAPVPSADSARVVGIQTAMYRLDHRPNMVVVKATRWDSILLMLARKYSGIERVLNLHNVQVDWSP